MSDPDYCYPPDFTVLRNRLNIRDLQTLELAERQFVAQRFLEAIPTGDFDLDHLKAIHHHLFQDIYEWAGEVRTVEIEKGGNQFQPRRFIETGMMDVHRRIIVATYFQGTTRKQFAGQVGPILGDVNFVHPFREGNGRVQLQYVKQLAERAGHGMDLTRLDREAWMEASRRSHEGDYDAIRKCVHRALL